MSWQTIAPFAALEVMLCLAPGPAVLLVLSTALTRGARASLWSALGILGGNTLYFILSAWSLGALLLASRDLFAAAKWLGAGYLAWLGLRALFGRGTVLSTQPAAARASAGRLAANGFLLQAANPKALLFFAALLPQFIDPAGRVGLQIAVLAMVSMAIELAVLAGYGTAAGRATRLIRQPRFASLADRLAGTMLVGAAIGMAAIRRS